MSGIYVLCGGDTSSSSARDKLLLQIGFSPVADIDCIRPSISSYLFERMRKVLRCLAHRCVKNLLIQSGVCKCNCE